MSSSSTSANKRAKVEDEPVNIIGSKTSKQQLGVRAYLDLTVVPVLLQALTALAKARPEDEDPAVYLANWILENQKKNPIQSIPKGGEEEEEGTAAAAAAAQSSPREDASPAPDAAAAAEEDAAATTTTTTTTTAMEEDEEEAGKEGKTE